MHPIYKIALDGEDITSNFNDRMLSMTVTEHSQSESDKLSIVLDDRDGLLEVPPTGRTLEVFLGYTETGVTSLGSYTIDTVRLQHKPSTMTLAGSSANLSKDGLKQHRTMNYEGKSLADIAGEIAARNGLKLSIDAGIGGSTFKILHQIDESDMNLLRRLGRDHDAIFKVAGGTLIWRSAVPVVISRSRSRRQTSSPDRSSSPITTGPRSSRPSPTSSIPRPRRAFR